MTPEFSQGFACCPFPRMTKRERNRQLRAEKLIKLVGRMGLNEAMVALADCLPEEDDRCTLPPSAFALCDQLTADGEMRLAANLTALAQRAMTRARVKMLAKKVDHIREGVGDLKQRIGKLEIAKNTKK